MLPIKDFVSKCDQIRKLRIWTHSLKKSITKNFIFCAVKIARLTHLTQPWISFLWKSTFQSGE